jgi:hypothetical protein
MLNFGFLLNDDQLAIRSLQLHQEFYFIIEDVYDCSSPLSLDSAQHVGHNNGFHSTTSLPCPVTDALFAKKKKTIKQQQTHLQTRKRIRRSAKSQKENEPQSCSHKHTTPNSI